MWHELDTCHIQEILRRKLLRMTSFKLRQIPNINILLRSETLTQLQLKQF